MADEKVRNEARSPRAARGEGEAGTPLARRMRDRLDESGAPVDVGGVGPGVGAQPTVSPTGQDAAIQEQIRARAYERYCDRGREPGHADEDWVEAEREVRGRMWLRGGGRDAAI